MNQIIILSGIPGSGKTYYADTFRQRWTGAKANQLAIVSADRYWDATETRFTPGLLGEAHSFCFRQFLGAIFSEKELIIVDNTNLTPAEIAPYHLAGVTFGYHVMIHRILIPHEVAWSRQTHGVPLEDFLKMVDKFNALPEQMPPWWNWSDI